MQKALQKLLGSTPPSLQGRFTKEKLAPHCFQWVKKEDRGKSGTHELMKRNGGK
jgi:hypothetical protein